MTEPDDTIPEKITVLNKQVRDYSGRKRINITNSDGLVKDDKVVILKEQDYNDIMAEYHRLQEIVDSTDNQKVTADAIGEKFLQPVKDSYNDIISGLKQDLKDKDTEINRLKAIYHDYDKQVYSLGLIDILRHKNKDISKDFNSKIWIKSDDPVVTDAKVKQLDTDSKPDDTDNGGDSQ